MFIGFMSFISLTKYNDGKKYTLNILQVNDGDNQYSGTSISRKKAKLSRSETRDFFIGLANSSFVSRGLSIEARVQVIEVARNSNHKGFEKILNKKIFN